MYFTDAYFGNTFPGESVFLLLLYGLGVLLFKSLADFS